MVSQFFANPVLFQTISGNFPFHSTSSRWWMKTSEQLEDSLDELEEDLRSGEIVLGELGHLKFPFREMGTINSTHLFGLHELILFSFYWRNRTRYKRVADLGANLGLHSLILELIGLPTWSYEPDPEHYRILVENLTANGVFRGQAIQKAVATSATPHQFIRVLGNTTGSHIAGAKTNPYGPIEAFSVETEDIREVVSNVDLVKMDVEGLEADLLEKMSIEDFHRVDILAEVGTEANATRIWSKIVQLRDVQVFSQKRNWERALSPEDLPHSHRDGSIFVSAKRTMPW